MIVAWGVVAGWEPGVWGLMGVTLMAPMLIAATLYFLAARMETVCAVSPARTVSPAAAQADPPVMARAS